MLLQITHTTFAAVILDEHVDSRRVEKDVRILKPGGFLSLRAKIFVRDDRFFLGYITADF